MVFVSSLCIDDVMVLHPHLNLTSPHASALSLWHFFESPFTVLHPPLTQPYSMHKKPTSENVLGFLREALWRSIESSLSYVR